MPQGRSSFTWYNGMSTQLGASGGQIPLPNMLGPAFTTDGGGQNSYLLYGHDYSESGIVGLGIPQEFVDAVEREKRLERIVGDVSFRMANPFDINVSTPGANPTWVLRTGFGVVPSNGNLGVVSPKFDGTNTSDSEFSWLYTDQFLVAGVDRGTTAFTDISTWSPSADGLNHYVVSRHYDVGVARRLEKNDVLLYVVAWSLFTGWDAVAPSMTYHGMFHGWLRVLGRSIG